MRFALLPWFCLLACSGKGDSPTDSLDTGTDDTDTTDTDTSDTDTDTTADPCDGVTPSVDVGTGIFSFEPIVEDQTLEMVYGAQGGWHFDTAALVTGIGPDVLFKGIVTVTSTSEVIAGENDEPVLVTMSTPGVGTFDEASCSGSFFGQFTFIDDVDGTPLINAVCALDDEEMVFELEVSDPTTGIIASNSVTVLARLDRDTPCP